ncbi:glycosyltransferase family 4 protein [Candidatus Saccharibacteria bacterium]|nr:glycosyltransferase family 4 protein [Candidatus Saccharibacteria bacterium]NIW79022.1 glycosyltransferase [Calditrichia bacterium]
MKILFATHEGVPLYGGGPYVKMLATQKHLRQFNVTVDLFNMWDSSLQLKSYDLIHLFGSNFATYNLARNLKYQGRKYVVNSIFFTRRSAYVVKVITAIDKLTRKFIPGIWWDYGFTRDICEWSECVLPNTVDEGKLIETGLGIPRRKIRVIPNGVSEEFLNGDPALFKKEYGLENFILNVGHIGPRRKNVLALVRALAKIDHPAVLITKILHTKETEQILAEAKQNKNLLIIDGLLHNSPLLASAYAACDVFVLPSQFETPGRAALEAALAGAKIVITPYGGTREYFKSFAEYVNPYSIQSIRDGIEKALRAPQNPALKEHVKQNFLWRKIARQTLDLYQEIIKI